MAQNNSQVNLYSYSGGNVSTSAYTTLVASTPTNLNHLLITDTSGQLLQVAIGAAGSEVAIAIIGPTSAPIYVKYFIPSASRIAIIALNSNATTGYNALSLLPW